MLIDAKRLISTIWNEYDERPQSDFAEGLIWVVRQVLKQQEDEINEMYEQDNQLRRTK